MHPPPSDALAEAARLDAAGDYTNAVNALARAARGGDLPAMTALGKRLLVGDRAPPLPREGAAFLSEATRKGGAEAPARLAVLVAAGVEFEQSWEGAFNLLLLAAERGWSEARAQLLVLASDPTVSDDLSDKPDDPGTWRRLSERIDVSALMKAPPGRTLHASPLVRAYAGFASGGICEWLIARASDRLGPALVYDPIAEENIRDKHRTNTAASFSLIDTDLIQLLVQCRMAACCGLPLHNMETMSVLHYDVGEQITNHYDFVDPKTPNYQQEIARHGQRVVTFLLYLNENYEGGDTAFPRLDLNFKGHRGDGLFFVNTLENQVPDLRTVHAGTPVLAGEKWVISQFIRDREVLRRRG